MLHLPAMVFYFIPAALVFFKGLQAFLEDESTPKTHFDSWVILVAAALLWPITLPIMVNRLAEDSADDDTNYNPALQNWFH